MNASPESAAHPPPPSTALAWTVATLADLVFLAALVWGVKHTELSAVRAGLLFVLGSLTMWFAALFSLAMRASHWPAVETQWGGLGGGIGGWRVSPAFIYLFGTLAFGSLLTVIALQPPPTPPADAAAATPVTTTTTTTTAPIVTPPVVSPPVLTTPTPAASP